MPKNYALRHKTIQFFITLICNIEAIVPCSKVYDSVHNQEIWDVTYLIKNVSDLCRSPSFDEIVKS
jgi:hypothetical protein